MVGTRQENNYRGSNAFTLRRGESKLLWELSHEVENFQPAINNPIRLPKEAAFQLALKHHLEGLPDAKIFLRLGLRSELPSQE